MITHKNKTSRKLKKSKGVIEKQYDYKECYYPFWVNKGADSFGQGRRHRHQMDTVGADGP